MGHFSWRNLTLVQLPEQWKWVPTFWSKPFLLLLVYDLALERWFLRTEIHKLTKNSYKPIIFQADTCLPVYNKGSNGKKDGSRTLGSTTIEKYLWPLFRYFCVFIQMHKLSITIMWNIINWYKMSGNEICVAYGTALGTCNARYCPREVQCMRNIALMECGARCCTEGMWCTMLHWVSCGLRYHPEPNT